MKQTMKQALALIALMGLVLSLGCRAVYVTKPVGEKPVSLKTEEWEGSWKMINGDGDEYIIHVADAPTGKIEIAHINHDAHGFKLDVVQGQVLQHQSWLFLNIENKEKPGQYAWGRIKNEGKLAMIWFPNADKVENLIKQKKLTGKLIKDQDILLQALTPKQLDLVSSDSQGLVLDWENPVILHR